MSKHRIGLFPFILLLVLAIHAIVIGGMILSMVKEHSRQQPPHGSAEAPESTGLGY